MAWAEGRTTVARPGTRMTGGPPLGARARSMSAVMGPAVTHDPARLHTWRVSVEAVGSSPPAGTLVLRMKAESADTSSPEPASEAVQRTVMLRVRTPAG